MKKKNANRIRNPEFDSTVDPALRELVKFLHEKKIATTPSCSGHHFAEKNFKQIYDELVEDHALIRRTGLKLKDVETGEIYFYHDENYELPWTEEEFLSRVKHYQAHGVLGIRAGRFRKKKKELLAIDVPGVKVMHRDGIILLYVHGNETGENKDKWDSVTAEVKKIFGEDED